MYNERPRSPILTSPVLPFTKMLSHLRSPARYNGYKLQRKLLKNPTKSDAVMPVKLLHAHDGCSGTGAGRCGLGQAVADEDKPLQIRNRPLRCAIGGEKVCR